MNADKECGGRGKGHVFVVLYVHLLNFFKRRNLFSENIFMFDFALNMEGVFETVLQ